MEKVQHKKVNVNGINMHIAELGEGPMVLLIHGFPELWYTWRHQMLYLAANGYRAVAPDLRGFGDTTGTDITDPTKFTMLYLVGDMVALIDAVAGPAEEKVFVVGHDWGSLVAWNLAMYRPDKIRAMVNLSVVFTPRNPKVKPVDGLRAVYGDDYYVVRMQEPGEIESEFSQIGTKNVLKHLLTYRNPGPLYLPKGKAFGDDTDAPIILPSWLSEDDVDFYATKYEQTGFTGGLNYYRAINPNWELNAPWTKDQIKVPVKFIVGDLDLTYNAPGAKDYIHKGGLKKTVPLLQEVIVLKDVAHFTHEEKPDEINKHIHVFFRKFSSGSPCSTL